MAEKKKETKAAAEAAGKGKKDNNNVRLTPKTKHNLEKLAAYMKLSLARTIDEVCGKAIEEKLLKYAAEDVAELKRRAAQGSEHSELPSHPKP